MLGNKIWALPKQLDEESSFSYALLKIVPHSGCGYLRKDDRFLARSPGSLICLPRNSECGDQFLTNRAELVTRNSGDDVMEDTTDVVDATVLPKYDGTPKRVPSIECLNSEMPGRDLQKDKGKRAIRILLNRLRLRKCASVDITEPDPTYKVAYLGNVVTGWAKGRFTTYIFCF